MASTLSCAASVRKAAADIAFEALRKAEQDLNDVCSDLESRLIRVASPEEVRSDKCLAAPVESMPEYFSEVRFVAERIDGTVSRLRSLYHRIEL